MNSPELLGTMIVPFLSLAKSRRERVHATEKDMGWNMCWMLSHECISNFCSPYRWSCHFVLIAWSSFFLPPFLPRCHYHWQYVRWYQNECSIGRGAYYKWLASTSAFSSITRSPHKWEISPHFNTSASTSLCFPLTTILYSTTDMLAFPNAGRPLSFNSVGHVTWLLEIMMWKSVAMNAPCDRTVEYVLTSDLWDVTIRFGDGDVRYYHPIIPSDATLNKSFVCLYWGQSFHVNRLLALHFAHELTNVTDFSTVWCQIRPLPFLAMCCLGPTRYQCDTGDSSRQSTTCELLSVVSECCNQKFGLHLESSLKITRESLIEGDRFEGLCGHRSLCKTSGIELCIQLTLDDPVAVWVRLSMSHKKTRARIVMELKRSWLKT